MVETIVGWYLQGSFQVQDFVHPQWEPSIASCHFPDIARLRAINLVRVVVKVSHLGGSNGSTSSLPYHVGHVPLFGTKMMVFLFIWFTLCRTTKKGGTLKEEKTNSLVSGTPRAKCRK